MANINGFCVFNDNDEVLSDKCFYDLLLEIKRKKVVTCGVAEHNEEGSFVLMLSHTCGKKFKVKMTQDCDFLDIVDELYDDFAKVYAKHKPNYSPNWLHPHKPKLRNIPPFDQVTATESTGNVLSVLHELLKFDYMKLGKITILDSRMIGNGMTEWHLGNSASYLTITLITPDAIDLSDINKLEELSTHYEKKLRKEQRKLANDAKSEPKIELDVCDCNITEYNIECIYSINQGKRTWIDTNRHRKFASDIKKNKAYVITKLTAQGRLRTAIVEYKNYVSSRWHRKNDPNVGKVYGNELRHKIFEVRYIVDTEV
jgi:hypothetical protein